jgi:heme-degrading monooxygenase HmoA
MVVRIWRGVVRTADADTYAEYIRDTGFNEYAETPGNRGAHMLRRDENGRTEFITFSLWDSREAIQRFAGEDIEKGVFYPEDDRYLIEREDTVKHYDVVDSVEPR